MDIQSTAERLARQAHAHRERPDVVAFAHRADHGEVRIQLEHGGAGILVYDVGIRVARVPIGSEAELTLAIRAALMPPHAIEGGAPEAANVIVERMTGAFVIHPRVEYVENGHRYLLRRVETTGTPVLTRTTPGGTFHHFMVGGFSRLTGMIEGDRRYRTR